MKRIVPILLLLMASLVYAQPTPEPRATITAIEPGQTSTVTIVLDIPDGYHAQSHKPLSDNLIPFEVSLTPSTGISVGEIVYPTGETKNYPGIGLMSVYGGAVKVAVPITIAADAQIDQLSLSADVSYQICNDAGTCFAPQTKTVNVIVPTTPGAGLPAPPSQSASVLPQRVGIFGYQFDLTSIWVVLPIGMVVGLLFNVMPCVLPVLPLKAMGFYEASQHDRRRALMFGLLFSAGLIAIFVGLAAFVLVSKTLLGTHFQWGQWFAYAPFVWGMTIVLVLLGISMLGAFTVQIPNSLYGLNFRHDTLSGNFLWGALTALLSTPCTAPMFAGLVTWSIGQPIAMGVAAMLSVGIGMALPYLFLSAFPELARSFPRTGPASELVKQAMAFPLLGTAAWLAGPRIVGDPQHWWIVVAVAIWGALFVMIRAAQILKSSLSVLMTTLVTVLVVGAVLVVAIRFNGIGDGGVANSSSNNELWQKYSDQSLTTALEKGRPVIVKFTASWCANCQVIEATVYRNPATLSQLRSRNVILIKADLTRSDAPGWKKLNDLGYTGIPLTALYLNATDKPILLDSLYTESDLLAKLPAK